MKALAHFLGLLFLFFCLACGTHPPQTTQNGAAPAAPAESATQPNGSWPADSSEAAVVYSFGHAGVWQVKDGETYTMVVPNNAPKGYRQIFAVYVPLIRGFDKDAVISGEGLRPLKGLERSFFVWEPPEGRRLDDIELRIDARKEHYTVKVHFLLCDVFDQDDPRCRPHQEPSPRLLSIGSYGLFEVTPQKPRHIEMLREPADFEHQTFIVWPPMNGDFSIRFNGEYNFLTMHPEEPSLLLLQIPADRKKGYTAGIDISGTTFVLLLRPRLF